MFSLSPRQCCSSLIKIKSNNIRQFIFQGLFAQREEDPSTRKILEGGNNFLQCYMQKFQSTWCPSEVEKGLKMEGDKNKNAIWALLLLYWHLQQNWQNQQNYHYNQLVETSLLQLIIVNTLLNAPPPFLSVLYLQLYNLGQNC